MVLLWRPLLPLLLCFLAFACSSDAPKATCQQACEGGAVCLEGGCERLCSRDADCDGWCCGAGVCGECTLSRLELTSVSGTGPENADSSRPNNLTVVNEAAACSTQGSLLRGEGTYTIGDSAQSGLILDGDALAVDPQFIVDVVNDAQPVYTLYVAHQEFLPATGTWFRAGYGTWRPSAEVSTVARAPLGLPDGASIQQVQCRAKAGEDANELYLSLQKIIRAGDAHESAGCGVQSLILTTGVVSLPLCAPNDAVDSDLESSSYTTYSLAAATSATTAATVIYGCRVSYSLP